MESEEKEFVIWHSENWSVQFKRKSGVYPVSTWWPAASSGLVDLHRCMLCCMLNRCCIHSRSVLGEMLCPVSQDCETKHLFLCSANYLLGGKLLRCGVSQASRGEALSTGESLLPSCWLHWAQNSQDRLWGLFCRVNPILKWIINIKSP